MDTRYLEKRRSGYYAVIDVPPKLVADVGRKRLRVSLKTRDLATAQKRRPIALEALRKRLEKATPPDIAMPRPSWTASPHRL